MDGTAAIVVAVITAVGGIIVALIQRVRSENARDHAVVQTQLDLLTDLVRDVKSKTDGHLRWHRKQRAMKK